MWGFLQFLVMFAVGSAAIYWQWDAGGPAIGAVAVGAAFGVTWGLSRLIDWLRSRRLPLQQEGAGDVSSRRIERL